MVIKVYMIRYMLVVTILCSIVLILIAHYSFRYMRDTLTPEKKKDLAGFQSNKITEIMNELHDIKQNIHINNKKEPDENMEDELLEFAREQANIYNIEDLKPHEVPFSNL